jgi:predicted ATP-grasp superfamily ATP-dependent carboligase
MARQKNDGRGRMGGRAKGTPNKTTAELKAWITQIIENGQDSFIERLENSDDRDYIKTYIGLLNYVLPKQAPTTPDDVLRKEKEMLQEMMLSMPDAMINRLAERLNNLIQKEDENKIR